MPVRCRPAMDRTGTATGTAVALFQHVPGSWLIAPTMLCLLPSQQCTTIARCKTYSNTDCKCTACGQYFTPASDGASCQVRRHSRCKCRCWAVHANHAVDVALCARACTAIFVQGCTSTVALILKSASASTATGSCTCFHAVLRERHGLQGEEHGWLQLQDVRQRVQGQRCWWLRQGRHA